MIIGVNEAAVRLLRRSHYDILGRAGDDARWGISGLEGEQIVQADLPTRRALRGEEPEPMAISMAAPDGGRLYLNQSATPVRGDDGRVEGAIVALTDIGDLHRARADLLKTHESTVYALKAAQIVLWEWDPATGLFELNTDIIGQSRFLPRSEAFALIHPDDRDRVRQAIDAAFESGEKLSIEFRIAPDSGEERWMLGQGRAVIGDDGARRIGGIINDVTERKRIELARTAAQEALALSEERLRLATEGTGAGVYDVDVATGESVWTADLFAMLGYPYSPGGRATLDMFYDVVHPDDIAAMRSEFSRLMTMQGPLLTEFRIRRADTREERWLSAYRRLLRVGGVRRAVGIAFDITDRKRAEERERLLMREIDHRAKNVLAVVQSVLQLTPREDIETYITSVSGRISAVARVHTLLAEDGWVSASMKALIEAELAAHRHQAGLIQLSGPDLAAPAHAAQAITMILHELATNAAKYGALSTPEGRLSISLDRNGDDMIIDWVEHVPHLVHQKPEPGFGSRLIATLAERQLGGAIVQNWSASGLSVRLIVPGVCAAPTLPSSETPREELVEEERDLTDRSILLVEDDAFVSMALEQALTDAGGRVRAFHNVDDALSSVRRAPPELAVLDVNVRGVLVTPVATELARLNVPFVYVTGYEGDLEKLPHGPIVHKPCPPGAVSAALQRLASAV